MPPQKKGKTPRKGDRSNVMINVRLKLAPPLAEKIGGDEELLRQLLEKIAREGRTPPGVAIASIEWGHPRKGSVDFRTGDISDLSNLRNVLGEARIRVGIVEDTSEE